MPIPMKHHIENGNRRTLENAFDYAMQQVDNQVSKYAQDYYPMYTVGGVFGKDITRWTHWCDGFFPGLMFIFASRNKSDLWLERAVARSLPLEVRQYDRSVHDLGFLFLSTYARWIELGGPPQQINPVLQQAGRTMAMRFMANGQYLRSFVEPSSTFIDIMMNVGVVFRAARDLSDEHMLAIAHQHCRTTRRTLVRGDGSTAHEALFNLETGECKRQSTQQGYRADSCWSRGLAWSMYGFTRSYRQSGQPEYLEIAKMNASYWIDQCPADGIAPWDFDAPLTGELGRSQVDTSASAIAAAALIDLAACVGDPLLATVYSQFAINTLCSLASKYLGRFTPGFEGILTGGVYHIHKRLGVHEAVMFGEYFFVEALDKALALLDTPLAPPSVQPYPEDTLPDSFKRWHDGPLPETSSPTGDVTA